jgi:hypothetical protein
MTKKRLPQSQLPVTDHAVIRYLERVAAIDIEAVRKRIYDDTVRALASGASGLVANGISYRFEGARVVTVWVAHKDTRPLNWPKKDGDDQ